MTALTFTDVESLAKWSNPKEVQTKYGPRMLRKAGVSPEFSAKWKTHKDELKALGTNFTKDQQSGEWGLVWWTQIDKAEQAVRAERAAESRMVGAEVDLPKPDGLDYLPFQRVAIRAGITRPNILLADEMGLGKTIEAIGIINADPGIESALIICPKTLKLNWARELKKWLVRDLTIGVADGSWPTTDIVIVNYDALTKFFTQAHARTWSALILDEAHLIKNGKTKRSENIKGRKENKQKRIEAIAPISAARHIRLTGTPIVNRPAELQNLIEDMDSRFAGFQFLKRYANAQRTGFGWDFSGASNLDELQRRLRESIMIRRKKAEVLTELPSKIRQIIEIEPTSAAMRACVVAEESFEANNESEVNALRVAAELAKAESETEYEQAVAALRKAQRVAFEEISRLRHATAIAKVPAVLEHIDSLLEDDADKKIIIGAHHHDTIEALRAGCVERGLAPVVLTGETTETDRQRAVDTFQSDPLARVFIGSILAAGVGITLTASNHVLFAELDWVPGNMTQFEDRAHRIGQTDSVLVQHLVLSGSIDARMAETLVDKQRVIDSALDKQHPERTAPVIVPSKNPPASHSATPDKLAQEAETITEDQITAVHNGLRILAGSNPDGATLKNDVGFNKFDTAIGASLANRTRLTPKQAALGKRIIRKYWRQLPLDLMQTALIEHKES